MLTLIFQLCLLMLISLSPASTLNLYADGPTIPPDVSNSSCCLPTGLITFVVIEQTIINSKLYDMSFIQADQWIGLGCATNNITASSTVIGLSRNTTIAYVNRTIRTLSTVFSKSELCETLLYDSEPDPLDLYAYGPTMKPYIPSSYCCVPRGPVKFVVVGQTVMGSELYDVGFIQADQWNGLGCAANSITNFTIFEVVSMNLTNSLYGTRVLMISLPVGICSTFLYDSALNSLDQYAASPTMPAVVSSSPCCLPKGPVTLVMVNQAIIDSALRDIVFIQAGQWDGLGCASDNNAGSAIVMATVTNQTYYESINNIKNTDKWLEVFNVDNEVCCSTLYDSDPDPLPVLDILGEVTACLSILACLWLFYRYYRSQQKTYGVQLILVLGVSDCLYHIFTVIIQNSSFDILSGWFIFLVYSMIFVQSFSIFWSTTISIILMKIFKNNDISKQFKARTWILSLLPSIILAIGPLIMEIVDPLVWFNLYWKVGIIVIPIILTAYCYILTIRALRKHSGAIKPKYHVLLGYPSVQILLLFTTIFPEIVQDDPNLSFHAKQVIGSICTPIKGLMGLANAIVYLLQTTRAKIALSQPKEDSSSDSLLKSNT